MKYDDPQVKQNLLSTLKTSFQREKTCPVATTEELQYVFSEMDIDDLNHLKSSGLAHDHIRIGKSNYLLRIPKQSQMRLNAIDNLNYQAHCFQRLHSSGHTPAYYGMVTPTEFLPMGCLVVEFIDGRPLSPSNEISQVAQALASIHSLALPSEAKRQPLINQSQPLRATLAEVQSQSEYLESSNCSPASKQAIKQQLKLSEKEINQSEDSPVSLISFDAHPGNFLIDAKGKAHLVDLEKARYGGAGFDLAHATLYTSTTWDRDSYCALTQPDIDSFYRTWADAMPANLATALAPHLLPMRRLMWLWSLTWCAKWTVQSKKSSKTNKLITENTEDWSAENSDIELIQHVEERVGCYLAKETIDRIAQEFER